MNTRLTLFSVLVLLGKVVHTDGRDANAVVGQWLTSEGGVRIEIFKMDGKYFRKIVWVKERTYPKDDPEAGKPKHDRKNPDVTKRDQPMIGLRLLAGFEYAGDNSWTHGTIYNPENGKTYKANLTLAKDGSLKIHGYVRIPLLGETTVWTRFDESAKAQDKKQDAPSTLNGVKRAEGN